MAEEIISLEFDFGNGVEKIESMAQAGKRFGETLESIRETVDRTIPGMSAFLDMSEQSFEYASKSVDRTQQQLSAGKIPEYRQDIALANMRNQRNSMAATVEDVRAFAALSHEIQQLIKDVPTMRQTLINELPSLMKQARVNATQLSETGSVGSVSSLTKQLLYQMHTPFSEHDVTQNAMKTIARYAVMTAVPQYQRQEYMEHLGGDKDVVKHTINSFRKMLPTAFAKIPTQQQYRTKEVFDNAFGNDTTPISVAEMGKLKDIIKNNRYMADAAVAAGAAKKINGELMFTGHLNRGIVNAMAGNLMTDIVSGAKGMPMYGIQDVEDPEKWTKIARKTNKQMKGALQAAYKMQESFGEWLTPDYYTEEQTRDLARVMRRGSGGPQSIGKIDFSPRTKSFEVAQYTADDLARGLSWNNGGRYDRAEDYHHITVDDSIQLRKIMQYGSGPKPHNSYTDDVVYFKIDERLADPNASDETKAQIKSDIARVWEQGFSVDGPDGSKLQYVATRVNPKMGIELVRKEIRDKIVADDPSFFSAGLNKTSFDPKDYGGSTEKAWKAFAGAMEYRNKNATPGESLKDLFGVDFFANGRTPNIAVVDIPGLDGASMIHNRYVPTGFQGRMTGVKSALMPVHLGKMASKYNGNTGAVEFMRATGDGTVTIDDTVDLILNKEDIKNFDERFAGKDYGYIVQTLTEDLRKDGLSALRTYGDADTPTRWISAQLAQTMQMSAEDVAMFNKAFDDEMLKLNSFSYVKDTVFAEDSEMRDVLEKNPQMFHTRAVQDRIRDYRLSMIRRKSQGDLFIPQEVKAHKAMAAPWVVDVFNNAIKAAGGSIPENMKKLSLLGEGAEADPLKERVVFLGALAESLGLARYPAAPGSIQIADNAAVGPNESGKVSFMTAFNDLAKEVGLNKDALYFAPGSALMQYMQSEDFDGDVNEIIEFSKNPETTQEALMQKIFEVTMRHSQDLFGKVKDVDKEARAKGLERSTFQAKGANLENLKNKVFKTMGPESGQFVAQFIEEYMKSSTAMGVPNAVLRNAYQMQMNRDVALAMYDAVEQYDTNSTQGKKAITRLSSNEEMAVLGRYKPFSEFFHMMNKATDESGEIDYPKLQDSNIWKINLPSMNASGNMRSALLSRFTAKRMGFDINAAYDWDKFFAEAGGTLDTDDKTGKLTPVGLMQSALKDVYKGFLNADYLALSETDQVVLNMLKQDALDYEMARVEQDIANGRLSEEERKITGKPSRVREAIARRRIDARGGMVIDNIGSYAAKEGNIDEDFYLMSDLYDYGYRDQDIFSSAGLADKYLSEGRSVVSNPGSRRILSAGAIERNRGILQTLRDTLSPDQIRGRLNDISYSPSTLAAFAANPEEWILDRFSEPGTRPQRVDTDQIKLGKAAEDATQGFMRLRQQAAQTGRILTQEELENARDRAVEDFDTFLKDGVSGKDGYSGLSESAFKEITEGRGRVGFTYQGVRKWLQDNLLDFMPESEYMVTGIERNRSFNNSGLGKTMPTENNPNEDPVKMTGRTDIEFTSRKTGNKTVVDMKVHDAQNAPETLLSNLHKATSQLQQYALSDEAQSGKVGEKIEGLKVLMPAIGKVFDVDASDEALAKRASSISEAIKVIQSLPESGLNPTVIKAAGQKVGELLFGIAPVQSKSSYSEFLQQDAREALDESKERMAGMVDKSSLASIGGVLTLHEDYKDSLNSLARVEKFANKKINDDNRQIYNQWAGGYAAIDQVGRDAESLRSQGMLAEADRLDMTRNTLKNNLDVAMIKSATADYEKFYDILKAVNTEMQVSKSASERIGFYRSMSEQATLAAQAHSELNAQIKNIDKDIDTKRAEANALRKAAEEETDEEKKKALSEEASRVEAYVEQQRVRKFAFQEASRAADAKKPQTDAEFAAFKSKYVADTFSHYDEMLSGFRDIRSGGQKSKLTSIADDIEAYVKSVKQAVADIDQMNKDGLFESEDAKKKYASMREQMTAAYGPDALREYEQTLISSSLSDAQSRMLMLRSSVSGTPISTEDQIKIAVDKKTAEMKYAKMDLEKRLGLANLSDDERTQYNDILSFYDSFDPVKYQTRLSDQAKLNEELRLARESRRTERLYNRTQKLTRDPFGMRSGDFISRAIYRRDNTVDQLHNNIEAIQVDIKEKEQKLSTKQEGSYEYEELNKELEKAKQNLAEAETAAAKLSGTGGTVQAAFAGLAESAGRIAKQFGRQLFHQAMQEAKRFVVEYDAAMTEIQMVTMKTDAEIRELGDSLIDTAIEMKVPVSDVTSAAVSLYRQGLSDEETDARMQDIIKFAKVANIKTETASKIITTAISNDLVPSSQEAMDVLVALGDAAATSADQIAGGMQRSAASAKEAGVSYEQLATMLTIITSKTQLSDSVAGTALKTLFYRLYRVGSGEDTFDENGNRIFSSEVTEALSDIDVSIFGEQGQFRGAYDILVDIASKWDETSDLDRHKILDTLAAGRQSSTIATLIQGLAEDEGGLAEKYMSLAHESKGVTDEKYLAYLDSLEASLNNVKSAFDELISSFVVTDIAIPFLDFIAELIRGFTSAHEATEGFTTGLTALAGIASMIIAVFTGFNPVLMGIGGALLAVGATGGLYGLANKEEEDPFEELDRRNKNVTSQHAETTALIARMEELAEKENRTVEETAELEQGMAQLRAMLNMTGGSFDSTASSATKFAEEIAKAKEKVEGLSIAGLKYNLGATEDDVISSTNKKTLDPESVKNTSQAVYGHKYGFSIATSQLPDLDSRFIEYLFNDGTFVGKLLEYGAAKHLDSKNFNNFLYGLDQSTIENWVSSDSAEVSANNLDPDKSLGFMDADGKVNPEKFYKAFQEDLLAYLPTAFEAFLTQSGEDNLDVYETAIRSAVIQSLTLSGKSESEIGDLADLYAKNKRDEIENAGPDYVARQTEFEKIYRGIKEDVFNKEGKYNENFLNNYAIENPRNYQVTLPDRTVIQNLSEEKAKSLAEEELWGKTSSNTIYQVKYANGDTENFTTRDEAEAAQAEIERQQVVVHPQYSAGFAGGLYETAEDARNALAAAIDDALINVNLKDKFQVHEYNDFEKFLSGNEFSYIPIGGTETDRIKSKTAYEDYLPHLIRQYIESVYGEGAASIGDETYYSYNGLTSQDQGTLIGQRQKDIAGTSISENKTISYTGFDGTQHSGTETEIGEFISSDAATLVSEMTASAAEAATKTPLSSFWEAMGQGKSTYETDAEAASGYDMAYEEMVNNRISTFEGLQKSIESGNASHLERILNSDGELANELAKYFTQTEDGGIQISENVDPAAFTHLLSMITSKSQTYSTVSPVSQKEKADLARASYEGILAGEHVEDLSTTGLKEILGDEMYGLLADYSQRRSEIGPVDEALIRAEYEKNGVLNVPDWDIQELSKYRQSQIDQLLPFEEQAYFDTLLTNAQYGITGLTEYQQLGYQTDLLSMIQSGNVSSLSDQMRNAYIGGNEDLGLLSSASMALEANDLSFADLETPDTDAYEQAAAVLDKLGLSTESVLDSLKGLNKELSSASVRASNKYGDRTKDVADNMDEWGKTTEDQVKKIKDLNSSLTSISKNQYYRDQWKAGKRTDEVKTNISELTGIDKDQLEEQEEYVDELLALTEKADMDSIQSELNAMGEQLTIPGLKINAESSDISGLISTLAGQGNAVAQSLQNYVSYLTSLGAEVRYDTINDGDAVKVVPVITKMPNGFKGGGGGGGGGGKKSAAEKLLEDQDHEQTIRDHIIKMIQFEETRYENAGELTNYGIMLQHEIDEERRQVKAKELNIAALKKQIAATEKYSDDWYSLRDAIMEAEEALAEMNNTIEENEKKLKENEQAILKLHTELEQEVKGEIETRIDEERTMLDGTVSMQDTILEAIRNRYEKEWELMQEDIDKKREALEEEIALIDERLERRKNAEDEAEKYEELAEYKRQLALISTDSTRTKDQATLREKIAELEKEIAWDVAEDEAEAQKEGLQDQIDAYDDYVEDYQEYLDDLLEDANNFADEVNSVMGMSHEEMIKWLEDNVEAYSNSLDAAQQQMTQGWDDMFKQMKGIVDTFWAEIAETLSSKDSFLAYMKESSAYLNASEDERKQMEYTWGTMYDDWIAAKKVSQEAVNYTHSDDYVTGSGSSSGSGSSGGSGGGGSSGKNNTVSSTVSSVAQGAIAGANAVVSSVKRKYGYWFRWNGEKISSSQIYTSTDEALAAGKAQINSKKYTYTLNGGTPKDAATMATAATKSLTYYKHGGLVDFTGPAWVDGTKSRPEAFLSAEDTQMIRSLIDGWKYIIKRPTITNVDGLISGGNSNNTIGEVYVTLNEAQFNTDDDYKIVAQRVGEAFTKELAKNGFTTASYAF